MQHSMDPTFSASSRRHSAARPGLVGKRAASGLAARADQREEHNARLARIRRLTQLMDSALRVPGTNFRVGLDGLIGLIPGLGDIASAGISAWIVREAHATGIPRHVLVKMLGNIVVDFVGGSIPLAGDLFDFYWKSNERNMALLESHLRKK